MQRTSQHGGVSTQWVPSISWEESDKDDGSSECQWSITSAASENLTKHKVKYE